MFESVVFPAPFSPSSACTSPSAASKSTWSFATTGSIAVEESGEAPASPLIRASALGAADHASDEPIHRVQVLDRQPLAFPYAEFAFLVVQRTRELVEAALDQGGLLLRDRSLRLCGHPRAVRGEPDEAVLEVPVIEAALPGSVHGCFGPAQVVGAPVVDRRREPGLRRKLVRVGVVADPGNAL